MANLIFSECGCSFEIADKSISQDIVIDNYVFGKHPLIHINVEDLDHQCPSVWKLLSSGNCKGVFQLEEQLGRHWAKELKPNCLEHLAALVAILRPGCLASVSGEPPKSLTQRYCDRKNKKEDVTYQHEALRPILENTHAIMIYQEQAILIARHIAGFSESEADTLRKACAKKDAKLMSSLEAQFIEGCVKVGTITKELAIEIFNWIRESQRYSFNACLTLDTIVETTDGFKTLEELAVGEKVKTVDDTYTEVLNKYDTGEQDVYEVILSNQKTIMCTLNHKFLCDDGKKHSLKEILEKSLEIVCEDDNPGV